jgi:hypothetical protein
MVEYLLPHTGHFAENVPLVWVKKRRVLAEFLPNRKSGDQKARVLNDHNGKPVKQAGGGRQGELGKLMEGKMMEGK